MTIPGLSFVTGRLWQIGAVGASLLALTLGIALIFQMGETRSAEQQRDTLSDQINNEETGFVVRLDRCRSNNATLKTAIEDQNDAIEQLTTETEARLTASEAAVSNAEQRAAAAEDRAWRLRHTQPQGETMCDRVIEVDEMVLESLQ